MMNNSSETQTRDAHKKLSGLASIRAAGLQALGNNSDSISEQTSAESVQRPKHKICSGRTGNYTPEQGSTRTQAQHRDVQKTLAMWQQTQKEASHDEEVEMVPQLANQHFRRLAKKAE